MVSGSGSKSGNDAQNATTAMDEDRLYFSFSVWCTCLSCTERKLRDEFSLCDVPCNAKWQWKRVQVVRLFPSARCSSISRSRRNSSFPLVPFSRSSLLYLSCCREDVLLVVLSPEHSFSHGDVEQSGSRDTVENKDRVHRVRNRTGRRNFMRLPGKEHRGTLCGSDADDNCFAQVLSERKVV